MCEPVSSCLSSIWKKLTKKVCWERGHVILNRSIDPPAKLIQSRYGTCLFCSLFVKCPGFASGSKKQSWFKSGFKENKVEQNVVVNNSIPDTTSTIDKLIDKLPTFTPKDDTASDFNAVVKNIKDDFEKLKKDIVSFVIFVQTRPWRTRTTVPMIEVRPQRPGGHLLSDQKL